MDTLPLVSPDQVGLSAARLARISSWMRGWVDSGKLPGMTVCVMRRGELAYAETYGKADVERNKPMRPDTIVRIYSMTKPLTSTAIMMLYEEGRFQLDDPISKFIPAFKNPRVYAGGSRGKIDSVPAEREITFRDLLTHTSGLTYGFMESTPVDAVYRDQKIDFGTATASLADVVERLAAVPLIAQPGKAWNYSVATDVLGYLVQVISGQPFDVFLREKVLKPLRMLDTDFIVAKDKQERFATCYMPGKDGKLAVMDDPTKSTYLAPRNGYSGGGGLAGTAGDYLRFCKFMLNKGELDGTRIMSAATLGRMIRPEDVPGGKRAPGWDSRTGYSSQRGAHLSDAAIGHGGFTGTSMWIDPERDLFIVLLATRLHPDGKGVVNPLFGAVTTALTAK